MSVGGQPRLHRRRRADTRTAVGRLDRTECRLEARERFSSARMVQQYVELYCRLIHSAKPCRSLIMAFEIEIPFLSVRTGERALPAARWHARAALGSGHTTRR